MPLGDNIKFKKRKLFQKTESDKSEDKSEEKEEKTETLLEEPEPLPQEEMTEEETLDRFQDESIKQPAKRVFNTKPFLLFELHDSLFGVEANYVKEIFHLPEVTPIEEAPEYIIGVVNLRGKIVPILDLDIRLGHEQPEYTLDHNIIVLELNGDEEEILLGIVVNQVHDVTTIKEHQMEEAPFQKKMKFANIIQCDAKVEDEIVMLLDHKKLIVEEYFEDLKSGEAYSKELNGKLEGGKIERKRFCPHATKEEMDIFKERAKNLRKSIEQRDLTGLLPLAVVGLNGEFFGVDLEVVREFSDLENITPIPCCPDYVIGSINLRGDILTMVDVRTALQMSQSSLENFEKVIVLNLDSFMVGVPVDNVFDIIYINTNDITAIPTALQNVNDEFLEGTAPYKDKMLSIIDLPKIFEKGNLIVNEEV